MHFSCKLKQWGETSLNLNPHITKFDSILLPCKSMEEFWKFTISFLCTKAWQQSLHEGSFHDVGSMLVSEYSYRRFSTKALEKQRPIISYTFPWDISEQVYAAIQTPARKYERELEENRETFCFAASSRVPSHPERPTSPRNGVSQGTKPTFLYTVNLWKKNQNRALVVTVLVSRF